MRVFILLYLLKIGIISLPNQTLNEWKDANAAWLSNKIYDWINKKDTDSGYVFNYYESKTYEVCAILKQKDSGNFFVVIRETKTLYDVITDSDESEVIGQEIEVKVHSWVKRRTDFYINKIDDKLKVCTEDIIITSHSLGGSIAYYLYLLYVKRHLEDWGQKNKDSRFKAILFGAPTLTANSEKENIDNYDNYINWYKYGGDYIAFIIGKVKNSLFFFILSKKFSLFGLTVAEEAYNIIQEFF